MFKAVKVMKMRNWRIKTDYREQCLVHRSFATAGCLRKRFSKMHLGYFKNMPSPSHHFNSFEKDIVWFLSPFCGEMWDTYLVSPISNPFGMPCNYKLSCCPSCPTSCHALLNVVLPLLLTVKRKDGRSLRANLFETIEALGIIRTKATKTTSAKLP